MTSKADLNKDILKLTRENAELRAEVRIGKRISIGQSISKAITTFFKYGFIALIFFFVERSIADLAGKQTDANILVAAVADFNFIDDLASSYTKVFCVIVSLFGVIGLGYGKIQSSLRKRTVKRLAAQIIELEEQIDPGRSSSNLTPTGDTNPEDR